MKRLSPAQKAHLFPGSVTAETRKAREARLQAAIAAGKVKRPEVDPFLERDKRAWWWVEPPKGVKADYEWAYYCWQTRSRRFHKRAQAEAKRDHATEAAKVPSGATAGWRKP